MTIRVTVGAEAEDTSSGPLWRRVYIEVEAYGYAWERGDKGNRISNFSTYRIA